MKGQERIKQAFERNARALELRPSIGQGTAVTRVRLVEGMRCEIDEGDWKLATDMGEKSGGSSSAPNPGILGRAALGSCLAVGYAMWAAKLGVPLDRLEIEVQADYDARGYHAVDEVEPGYSEIRYVVTVESDAPESDIRAMLDRADAVSDYLHVFQRPQTVRRETRIMTPDRTGSD